MGSGGVGGGEEASSSSSSSTSTASSASVVDHEEEDEDEKEEVVEEEEEEEEEEEDDYEEDVPRAAYAPDEPPHAHEPPTELPGLRDLERNLLADGTILAASDDGGDDVVTEGGGDYYSLLEGIIIAELNETIASLEIRAKAAEDEILVDRARLEEALEAKERIAAEYAYAAGRCVDSERRRVEEVDARERSRAEIKRLRDEHEASSDAASARVRRLRGALRSANDRKRRLERERDDARRRMESAEVRAGRRYAAEIDSLKISLSEKEGEIRRMERLVMENEDIVREERERLMAEIM